jgi:hypothetical protein
MEFFHKISDRFFQKFRVGLQRHIEMAIGKLLKLSSQLRSAAKCCHRYDPSWPETPGPRCRRLHAKITGNRGDPSFLSPVVQDVRRRPYSGRVAARQ